MDLSIFDFQNCKIIYNLRKSKYCVYKQMRKNENSFQSVQVDPITGEYYVIIPEWIANELSWYEDTEIKFTLDGNEVVLSEKN